MTPRALRVLLVTGLLLVLVGALGGTITAVVLRTGTVIPGPIAVESSAPVSAVPYGGFATNGERIYYTGVGHSGPIQIEWRPAGRFGGMMSGRGGAGPAGVGCVACHGQDGAGAALGMMFDVQSADIRYESLTRPHADETDSTVLGWTDADIARAIRDGMEPDGEALNPVMPRWKMDDIDMADLIGYLKELR